MVNKTLFPRSLSPLKIMNYCGYKINKHWCYVKVVLLGNQLI